MIGASIAAAAVHRAGVARVVAYSPGNDALDAQAAGWVHRVCADAPSCLNGSDLVVLAAPVSAIEAMMPQLATRLEELENAGLPLPHLSDTGSSKVSIVESADRALGRFRSLFLPAHPIAGSEQGGAQAANPDLFVNRSVLVCSDQRVGAGTREAVSGFWKRLGARVETIDPAAHDALYGEVSHWPHAAAFALCLGIARGPHAEPSLLRAGAGLRDTTRIAASDARLWSDIILSNRDHTLQSAQRHLAALRTLVEAIEANDMAGLCKLFEEAAEWRRQLREAA
jgi:prephenate dehydrogenase